MPGILNELRLGYAMIGAAGHVVGACPRYAELLGLPVERVFGLTLEDTTHPEDLEGALWILRRLSPTNLGADLRKRYVRPSGETIWVEQHYRRLNDPSQSTVLTVYALDEPSRRNNEQAVAVVGPGGLTDMADYVTDMTAQLATLAVRASLPVTGGLLAAAAKAAEHEKD